MSRSSICPFRSALRLCVAFLFAAAAALAMPRNLLAQGTPYYFDVNGAAAGFGTPTNGATYNQDGSNWTTDINGVSPAPGGLPGGAQLTFGASGSDFAGASFYVNMDSNNWTGLAINSSNANITLIDNNGANAYLIGTQTWTVAAGSTLTDAIVWSNNALNFNGTALTLAGGGTINFQTPIGYNDANTITENGTGLVVNLYANTAGANSGSYNLVSGTLNFATAAAAGAFNSFGSGSTVTIGGATSSPIIDNTSGGPTTLAIGSGSYRIGGNFTFTGSNSLSLGAAAVTLTASPTINVGNNALTIGGPIGDAGAGLGISKAGNGLLVLSGANTYGGGTTINTGTLRVTSPSGGTSSGIGTGALTANAGGAFSYLTGSATTSTFTLLPTSGTSLTLAAGSSIGTQILDTIALNATGTAVASTPVSGSVTLNIYGVNGQTVSAGTQTLLSSPNGGLNSNGSATFVPAIYNNTNFTVSGFAVGANAVTINTTPQMALSAAYWLGGFSGGSGVWAASDGVANSNWASDGSGTPTPLIPGSTATVNFSAAGATGQGSMTLGAAMSIAGLVSNDSSAVKLNNDVNGDTLAIGSGGITVGNSNATAGAVTINAPLVLSAPQSWTNNSSNALTVGGSINNGTNLLTIAGSGAGGTTISGSMIGTGGLTLATNATINASSSALTIQPGTISLGSNTLTLASPSAAQSISISSPITGSGGVTMASGPGVATLSGGLSYTGGTTLDSGSERLVLQNVVPAGSSAGISIGSGATLQYNFTATSLTQPGTTITGAGTLLKTGTGSLNFGSQGNVNWNLGAGSLIDIEAGSITGGNSIQDFWTNNLSSLNIASGAAFYGVEANVRIDALTGSGTFEGGYGGAGYSVDTIGVNNGSGTFYGSLQNDAAPMNLAKIGTGTETFAGSGSYTGTTTVSGGTLRISGAISDATPITVNSGAILSLTGNNATGNGGTAGTYTINGGTISNDGPAGTTEVINGNLTLNGGTLRATSPPNATYGNFFFNNNTAQVVVTGTAESTISASLHLWSTHIFNVASTGNPIDLLVSGQIGNFEGSAFGLITKTGAGTMALTNSANSFGDLAINAGQVIFSTGGLGSGGAGYKADFTGNSTLTWAAGNTDDPSAGGLMKIEDGVTATLNTNGNTVLLGTPIVVGTNGTGALNVDDTAGTPGVLILGGANTYSGGTTIAAGTLRLTGSGTFGNSSSALTMTGGVLDLNNTSQGAGLFNGSASATVLNNGSGPATLTVGNGNATGGNYLGVIADNNNSGTGRVALTKTGTGTFQLSAVNTYSGPTTVNAGTLVLGPAAGLRNTAISVNSGGTFLVTPGSGSLSAGNAATAGAGASLTLNPGTGSNAGGSFSMVDGAIGVFALRQGAGFSGPALTLGGTGSSANAPTLAFEIGSNGSITTTDTLAVGGGVSVGASGASISFSALSSDPSLTFGNYTFITAASGLGSAGLSISTPILNVGGAAYALSLTNSTATQEILTIASSNPFPANAYWNGAQGSNWNTFIGSGTTNWSTDATGATDTAQVPGNTTNVFFTVNSSASNLNTSNLNTNLVQPFSINSLNFTGTGTGAVNPVSISASTLTIEATNANGNTVGNGMTVAAGAGAVTIASNVALGASQTWTNNSTNAVTVSGAIGDGGGNYSLTTAGLFTLTNANTYGGGTTIASGLLNINADAALGTAPSSPAINLTFSGSATLQAAATINLSVNRNVSIGAGVTATIDTNSNNVTIPGVIAGGDSNSSLVKIGAGTLILSGADTYAGGTTVNAGTLQLGDGTSRNGSVAENIVDNSALVFANPNSENYAGVLSGSGTVTQTGAGILTLSGNNSANGSLTLNGGTVNLTNPQSFSSATIQSGSLVLGGSTNNVLPTTSTVSLANSGTTFDLGTVSQSVASISGVAGSNVNLESQTLTVTNSSPATFAGTMSGAGSLVMAGSSTLTLTGANTFTGPTTVSSGTLRLGDGISNNGSVAGNIANNATLTFANPNTQFYTGVISGSGPVNKTGAGALTLSGANSNNGALTVNGGTLTLSVPQSYASTTIQSGTVVLGGFALPSIPSLSYHLDASVSGSLSLNGSSVSAWNDLSGNGVNFTQGTTANQPTYVAGGINGLGAVSFNGSTSVLAGSQSTNLQTVFIIDQPNSALYTNLNGIFGQNNNDYSIRLASATSWQNTGGSANGNDFTGSGGSMYINGRLQSGNGAFTANAPQLLEAVSAGVNNFTAALGDSYPNRYFGGTIGEVLVYNGTLTTTQQQAVDAYLTDKWLTPTTTSSILPTTSTLSLTGSGATLDLGTTNENVASVSGVAGSSILLESQVLTISGSSSTAFAGSMSGAGSLVMAGSGVFTLSGASTYSGGTTVGSGTLRAANGSSGSATGSGPVLISSGGTLGVSTTGGSGTISPTGSNTVTIAGGGILAGANGVTLTLTGGLTLQSGAIASANLSGMPNGISGSNPLLAVTGGSLSFASGTYTVNLTGTPTYGTYDLINYTGATASGSGTFQLGTTPGGFGYQLQLNTGIKQLDLVVFANSLTWTGANSDSSWTTSSADTNWASGSFPNAAASQYVDGATVTFADQSPLTNSAIANSNVVIPSGVNPASVTFTNSTVAYTINSSGGGIGGSTGITLNGAGSVTFIGPNTYTGTTALNAGMLVISNNNSLGSTSGTIAPLTFNGGTLQYAASSTNTDISGRTVTINSGGATIDINGNNVMYANAVGNSGSGGLTLINSGTAATLTLGGANTYTGATRINSGTLRVAATGSLTSTSSVSVNSGGALSGAGVISGPVSVASGGILAPTGAPGGATTMNLANGLTLSTGSVLDFNVSNAGSDLIDVSSGTFTIGSGTLNIYSGGGTLTPNTYYPLIDFTGAPVNNITTPWTVGNSGDDSGHNYNFVLTGNVFELHVTTSNASASWSNNGSGLFDSAADWSGTEIPSGAGLVATFGNSGLTASPINVAVGSSDVVGGLVFNNNSSSTAYTLVENNTSNSLLTLNNNGSGPNITVSAGGVNPEINAPLLLADGNNSTTTFNVGSGSYLDVSGAISETASSGQKILLTGGGSLELDGANTYTGSTTINAGTLLITAGASVKSNSVSVAAGGTLQLAGSTAALPSTANITTHGTGGTGDGAFALSGTATQTVGVVSGDTLSVGGVTTYSGNTTVGDGTNAANLTATQILQNTLTINAGSTVTIAPSGSGIPADAVAATAAVATSDVASSTATADGNSASDPFTAIQAAIASGSIGSAKGQQLENRIAAIERLAATDPGLDVSLLEDRVLAALPAQTVWSSSGTSPLIETGSGLLAVDSSAIGSSSGSGLNGAAVFAPAADFGGSPAAVPEPSALLLAILACIGILIALRRRTVCCD